MKGTLVVLLMFAPLFANGQSQHRNLYFFVNTNGFSATGRWVPSNPKEKAAFPAETEIDCDRQTGTCVEASAELYYGHPHVSLAYYSIVEWDGNGILATSSNSICMKVALSISFADKSVLATHSIKQMSESKKKACAEFGASATFTENFVIKNSERWSKNPYGER